MTPAARTRLVVAGLALAAGIVLAITLLRPSAPEATNGREPAIPMVGIETIVAAPHLLFRHVAIDDQYNHLSAAPIEDPNARRGAAPLECERVGFGGGRGICLQAHRGVFTSYEAVVFDAGFRSRHMLKLDGSPSRTRISHDGRYGAITVFVTGQEHGYASTTFSTKTTIVDLASGAVLGELEQFTTSRDGQLFHAADFNFWGVTFTNDANVFYATLMSAKRTYLVRGDISARSLTVVHENVECPAISPDNTRIAYKKRVGADLAPWRFYVLDLATMAERPIAAETRSIDDQLEWLDDSHVLYGVRRSSQSAITDVWIASIDQSEPPREYLRNAESPVIVR
jgi:hypothetical protein